MKPIRIITIILTMLLAGVWGCEIKKTASQIDLSIANIGAMTGTTGEKFITDNYPHAHLSRFDSIPDAIKSLKDKSLDYVITSRTNAIGFLKHNKDLLLIPGAVLEEGVAIAINKEDTELLNAFNEVLEKYKNDGTLDDIINRWIKTENTPYEQKNIPVYSNGRVLVVGVAANREPMCFVDKGKIIGLDAELVERIAYELKYKVEYLNMPFAALFSALESGKVNLVISNVTATDERRVFANFTQDYFQNPQVLMTNK